MWHIRPQTRSQSSLFICMWSWKIGTSSPRRVQRFFRGLFLSQGDWGEEKMMGMTMGRKKEARTFSLFPSSTASYFFFFWMRYFHWSTEREPLRRTTCISSLSRLQYVLLWDESDNSVGCGRAVFTPILGSWRFFPLYFPPIMRYIRSQYTGMRYWKQCLQAQPTRLSKVRPRFSRSSSRCAFPTSSKPGYLSWGWEQVTEGRHKIRST